MTQDQQLSRKPERASLAIVYFTVFLDLLGFGLILPFLPYYALELGATGLGLGLLLTSYSLAQLCGASILGRLSDRQGRRPILLLSLGGAALGMVLSGLAQTLVTLCLARALAGLFGGSIATAQAYIADVTTRDERARFMGFLGASIGLGFVVGPALGVGLLALGFGFAEAAFSAAGLATANLCWAILRLRESWQGDRLSEHRRGSWHDLRQALGRADLRYILGATFFTTYAFVSMETTFAPLGEHKYGMDERGFGLILVFIGVIIILIQGGLIGRLTKRFEVRPIAAAGGALMGLSLILLPWMPNLTLAAIALAGLAAGQGLASPTLSSLLSLASGAGEQGRVLGLGQSLSAAARAFGPLLAGLLFDLHQAAPFVMGGFLALLAGILLAKVRF